MEFGPFLTCSAQCRSDRAAGRASEFSFRCARGSRKGKAERKTAAAPHGSGHPDTDAEGERRTGRNEKGRGRVGIDLLR